MAVKNYFLDLSTIIDVSTPQVVVPGGNRIGSISITNFPAGATPFRIHLGQQDGFLIKTEGEITGIEDFGDAGVGIAFSNPAAQPGLIAEISVGYSGVPFPASEAASA